MRLYLPITNKIFSTPLILLVVLAIIMWTVYFTLHPNYFYLTNDTANYADIARNSVSGRGFTANTLHPSNARLVILNKLGKWPSIYPPLQPGMIAISFLFLGINEYSVAVTSGIFYVTGVILVYLISKKLFTKTTAILASVWYIFTPQFLEYGISGTSESLFTFLVLLLFYLLIKRKYYLAGFITVLATLTKSQGILLLISVIYIIFLNKNSRIKPLFGFLAGYVITISISKLIFSRNIYSYQNFSNHMFWATLALDAFVSPYQSGRFFKPIEFADVMANISTLLPKFIFNTHRYLKQLFWSNPAPIILFYLLSFLKKYYQSASLAKHIVYVWVTIFSIWHILTVFDFRYLHPLMPILIIFASDMVISIFMKFPHASNFKKNTIIAILVIIPLVTFPGLATHVIKSVKNNHQPTIQALLGQTIIQTAPTAKTLVSDEFTTIAWITNKNIILLPVSIANLNTINDTISRVEILVLTDYPGHPPLEDEWRNLIENPRDFGQFKFIDKIFYPPETNFNELPFTIVIYKNRV